MNVIINCVPGDKEWYPGSFSGGSEEQTILLAEQLTHIPGCRVAVYNSVKTPHYYASQWYDNEFSYLPSDDFDPNAICDVYFGWRNWRLFPKRYAPIQVLLCHDIPVHAHFPTKDEIAAGALDHIDYVHTLNEYHRGLYEAAGCPSDKLVVIPIIIKSNAFVEDKSIIRDYHKCIWMSHPNRGVHKLREYWPRIKAAVPEATLQPCWWDESDAGFFLSEDKNLGILPTKLLNHAELEQELATAFAFPYCCTFDPEISPASCLKAVNAGLQPIVIPKGGIKSTLGYGAWYADENNFVNMVIQVLTLPQEMKEKLCAMLTCYGPTLVSRRPEAVLASWKRLFCIK